MNRLHTIPALLAFAALALSLAATAGCAADAPGKPHPYNVLDYPVAITADPSGRTLWITSGNFDLEFGGGAVVALDIASNQFVPGAAIEVGAFSSGMAILTDDAGQAIHGYVVSRETDGLYHADIGTADGSALPTLKCIDDPDGDNDINTVTADDGTVQSFRCQNTEITEGTVTDTNNTGGETTLSVGSDPFAVFVRKARYEGEPDLLLTGSMVSGNLATFELAADGTPSLVGNMELPVGLFVFVENPATGLIYAASKSDATVTVLDVDVPEPSDDRAYTNPYIVAPTRFELPATVVNDHARDMAITGDGRLLVTTHRSPNSVIVTEIGETATGGIQASILHKVPVGFRPGDVEIAPAVDGVPELAYVACFGSNRVDVVNPRTGLVVDRIPTGRGPFSMAYVVNADLGIRRLYVTHFYNDSVGAIELDPSSPYYHQEIIEVRGAAR